MVEAVVTIVVPEVGSEPAHTEIHRLEFESHLDAQNFLLRSHPSLVSAETLRA
jgi:hypothetical protein